jgi:hypothetical protein
MMKILQVLLFLAALTIIDTHYSLYHSDNRYELYDCLYAYLKDTITFEMMPHAIDYHLIPYCRQLDQIEEYHDLSNVNKMITFAELYRQGITSLQLLDWSSSIDIAERYEKDGQYSNEVFYNCSSTWFGSMCQYKFNYDI